MNTTLSDKTIHIALDKNKQLTIKCDNLTLPEIIQLNLAAIELSCKQTLARSTDAALTKSLEEDMYEMINLGASTLLSKLFPDIEMRPDVTVDALQATEDELLSKSKGDYEQAYEESAQVQKDIYENAMNKAALLAQNMNRAQRRKAKVKSSK